MKLKASEVLCELWNDMTIDGHIVNSSSKNPDEDVRSFDEPSSSWIESHCLISKCSLQISKCSDRSCCSEPRSNIQQLINGQSLPGTKLLSRDSSGRLDINSNEPIKYKTRYTNIVISDTLVLLFISWKVTVQFITRIRLYVRIVNSLWNWLLLYIIMSNL